MAQYTGVAVSPGRVIGTIRTMAPPVAEPAPDELGGGRRPGHLEVTVELLAQARQVLAHVATNQPAVPVDGR